MDEDTKEIGGLKVKGHYTHGILKAYKNKLFHGVDINTADVENIDIPLTNISEAEEILVMWMAGLDEKGVSDLKSTDYEAILEYIKTLPDSPM